MALPQKWKELTFTGADEEIAQLEHQAKERQVPGSRCMLCVPSSSAMYDAVLYMRHKQHSFLAALAVHPPATMFNNAADLVAGDAAASRYI